MQRICRGVRCISAASPLLLRCISAAPQVILENFTSLGNVDPNLVSSEDIANFKEARATHDSTRHPHPLAPPLLHPSAPFSPPPPLHPSAPPPLCPHQAWAAFDPDANSWIAVEQLPVMLLTIPPPMGLKMETPESRLKGKARALSHCAKLSVPEHEGEVKFDEVLHSE